MSKRNLNAKSTTHNFFLNKLQIPKIKKIYLKFKNQIKLKSSNRYAVAVSGGPDSLALVFLSKVYSLKEKISFFYFIVDHKIRKNSTDEAKKIRQELKKYNINCKILTWVKKKNQSYSQSKARNARYDLIIRECKKKKIEYILTAHHIDDLQENFFIRLVRGSGLKGLISFNNLSSKIKKNEDIRILRPLLNIHKKDLVFISRTIFNNFVSDPSNKDNVYLRTRIRNLIKKLKNEGLDLSKFNTTLENLNKSNLTIDYYVLENIKNNSQILRNKKSYILNKSFFFQPDEIVFRSISKVLHDISDKKNFTRGAKIANLIIQISSNKEFRKTQLSGCIIEKLNNSIVISKES